jgi:hypothetical protein
MALSLAMLAAFYVSASAAEVRHLSRNRERIPHGIQDTPATVTPVPIVDDTPINPDSAGDNKAFDSAKRRDSAKGSQKKRSFHRR